MNRDYKDKLIAITIEGASYVAGISTSGVRLAVQRGHVNKLASISLPGKAGIDLLDYRECIDYWFSDLDPEVGDYGLAMRTSHMDSAKTFVMSVEGQEIVCLGFYLALSFTGHKAWNALKADDENSPESRSVTD